MKSEYLKSIINADDRTGCCDFCGEKNISIYPVRELAPFFSNMLSLYESDSTSGKTLAESIQSEFGVFNLRLPEITELLQEIFKEETNNFRSILNGNVSLQQKSTFQNQSNEIHNKWSIFKREIKFFNRYHIKNTINLHKLSIFFKHESFKRNLKKGKIFFRGRISSKEGFKCEEMGKPPNHLAPSGRANPEGISYLYVADSEETVMHETRATRFDYITIGEFQLKEDLKILNLLNQKSDPMYWSEMEELENYLIYIPFIETLQRELSLPMRKADNRLEYIPTQYITEFIKNLGFDGIAYQSSLNAGGYNLAIFSDQKLTCCKTNIYEIKNIHSNYKKIE
ncbi:MAG: RES family NAD+ phosphorylase [Alcaligenaceae bacterium]|nr:RES family NAD+ phosphorylase [Alcaligenaceae bacterium]